MWLEHRLSALLQLLFHSRLSTWLQWVGKRQLQDKTRKFKFWNLGCITGLAVYVTCETYPMKYTHGIVWFHSVVIKFSASIAFLSLISQIYFGLLQWHWGKRMFAPLPVKQWSVPNRNNTRKCESWAWLNIIALPCSEPFSNRLRGTRTQKVCQYRSLYVSGIL